MNSRTALVDVPIIEMILSNKFPNSKFVHYNGITECHCDGIKRSIITIRNSSKYYNSQNFILSIDKNNISIFNNAHFIFIDESADCLYLVTGTKLLTYILDHFDNIKVHENNKSKNYILIPKKDIFDMLKSDKTKIIKYGKSIALLFESCRDENVYNV